MVPGPALATSQVPAILLAARGSRPPAELPSAFRQAARPGFTPLSSGSSADPRINNILFPKGSNPCPKPYSWGVTDVGRGPGLSPHPTQGQSQPATRPSARSLFSKKTAPEAHSPAAMPSGPRHAHGSRAARGAPCWATPPGEPSGTPETHEARVTAPPGHARLKTLAHAR